MKTVGAHGIRAPGLPDVKQIKDVTFSPSGAQPSQEDGAASAKFPYSLEHAGGKFEPEPTSVRKTGKIERKKAAPGSI